MYIIVTSFHIHNDCYDEVLSSVTRQLMPQARESHLFSRIELCRILVSVDPDMTSFAVNLGCASLDKGMEWMETHCNHFLESMRRRFGEKVLFFTTPMETLS